MGYGQRTHFNSTSPGWEESLRWAYDLSEPPIRRVKPFNRQVPPANAVKWRTAKEFNNKGIVADLIGDPRILPGVHKTGVNVLYGNFAVKWVPIEFFKHELVRQSVDNRWGVVSNSYYTGPSDALAKTWEIFDRN
jgi:hypothetical protein